MCFSKGGEEGGRRGRGREGGRKKFKCGECTSGDLSANEAYMCVCLNGMCVCVSVCIYFHFFLSRVSEKFISIYLFVVVLFIYTKTHTHTKTPTYIQKHTHTHNHHIHTNKKHPPTPTYHPPSTHHPPLLILQVERSQCVRHFTRVFGTMPLKTVEFRADPVLLCVCVCVL